MAAARAILAALPNSNTARSGRTNNMNRNDYDEIANAVRSGVQRLDGEIGPGGSLESIDPPMCSHWADACIVRPCDAATSAQRSASGPSSSGWKMRAYAPKPRPDVAGHPVLGERVDPGQQPLGCRRAAAGRGWPMSMPRLSLSRPPLCAVMYGTVQMHRPRLRCASASRGVCRCIDGLCSPQSVVS